MRISGYWRLFKRILRKVAQWIENIDNKELGTFLLFVLVAASFWFLQNIQSTFEAELTIPINYKEVPDNITITNKLTPSVQVTIRDKGWHLYGYAFHKKALALDVNLMNWRTPSGIGRIPISQFESRLHSKLKPGAQILRISPDSIMVYFVEKESKTLPIHLNAKIDLSPQHILVDNPILTPSFITAYAPISILESLDVIETLLLKTNTINDTTSYEIELKPIDGVQFSQQKIKVTLPVEVFTEITYSIPIVGRGFPADYELRSFPQSAQVSFLVSESHYNDVHAEDFVLAVDYQDIINSSNESSPIKIVQAPNHAKRVVLKPDEVDCLIEKVQ